MRLLGAYGLLLGYLAKETFDRTSLLARYARRAPVYRLRRYGRAIFCFGTVCMPTKSLAIIKEASYGETREQAKPLLLHDMKGCNHEYSNRQHDNSNRRSQVLSGMWPATVPPRIYQCNESCMGQA